MYEELGHETQNIDKQILMIAKKNVAGMKYPS